MYEVDGLTSVDRGGLKIKMSKSSNMPGTDDVRCSWHILAYLVRFDDERTARAGNACEPRGSVTTDVMSCHVICHGRRGRIMWCCCTIVFACLFGNSSTSILVVRVGSVVLCHI